MSEGDVLAAYEALENLGALPVLSGGWGIDALLGRRTREHQDVDVGVDALLVDDAIELLAGMGYSVRTDQRPARIEMNAVDGRMVDLHPIRWASSGDGRQAGFGDRVFRYPAHDIVEGTIGGQAVRCISHALQREFHTDYELSARDRSDLELLD